MEFISKATVEFRPSSDLQVACAPWRQRPARAAVPCRERQGRQGQAAKLPEATATADCDTLLTSLYLAVR